ncbi:MAG: hypothetical protein AB7F64_03200 [Gammaproteobacteria bacterium]
MSLEKFEDLLKSEALYFSSVKKLEDDFEGSITDYELREHFNLEPN